MVEKNEFLEFAKVFGNNYGTWNIDKGGFGEYKFDKNGNIIFDTNAYIEVLYSK